jgi:hypothetical protein
MIVIIQAKGTKGSRGIKRKNPFSPYEFEEQGIIRKEY